ncbi:DEAD/DEAH box helicase [Mycobacterium helveticum]|uniref:DEAD/DEAH box helicase n=1 Tax=Mycobacterium helveticum TaxID=2592811 RepID=A0A557XC56_9MYCO|nr:DEAD/DEAH box helicase [Mycobacterium helveticum]TVS77859.1 DEAD/DEAH box helicase [Mycobacterium helveticum]TVS83096.1 DEAD/DEAH box helicase [Mycobacterium helveticum]
MPKFDDLLAALDPDPRVRGKQFEHVCKWFLANDPMYKATLRRVWLWNDWPGRWGIDAGIDLVAEDGAGRLWAVQAKVYAEKYSVTKADVDKFLSESSRTVFSHRLLIATTDKMHPLAQRTIDAQEKKVSVVGLSTLLTAEVDWPASIANLRPSKPRQPAKPRDHQQAAIRDVQSGFKDADRGQLIMACGTGKTLTALFIVEKIAADRVLILVPSLSLLKQTLRVWQTNAKTPFEALPVCSDETVGCDDDIPVARVSELGVPVTTNPADIATFLQKRSGPRVVFSTYQSSPRIAEAFTLGRVPAFDLVIADEAHRCAGPVSSDFATVIDGDRIKAHRRLFMTATPRYYTGRVIKAAKEDDFEVASMDDPAVFGTVFHRLGFSEAIRRDLLTDYQVVVVGVDDATYLKWTERGTLVTRGGQDVTDARSLAGQIGLAKAMWRYDLRRIISFHSRVNRARDFAAELPDVIDWMPGPQWPKGELWADYASGEMTAGERHIRLQHLSRLGNGERGLLANARCLAEGVDVPTLDGVAFIDPRRSEVDIVQAVGRAIRKADDKTVGTIVIPVFIDTDVDPEVALDDSAFKPVWDVIKALRAHDDELAEQIDSLRRELGRRRGVPKLPDKIHLDVPVTVGPAFAEAFDTRLVEQASAPWEFWFGLLERYVAENETALVPQGYTMEGSRLGQWVMAQRVNYAKKTLAPHREHRLKTLRGWAWDARAEKWEKVFACLLDYVKQHGNALVPATCVFNGVKLGSWVVSQRVYYAKGALDPDRAHRLAELSGWAWDVIDAQWEEGFSHLLNYVEQTGHARVPSRHLFNGYKLGNWVAVQRDRYRDGTLDPERARRLKVLPDWTWTPHGDQWEEGFTLLVAFVERTGHANVPYSCTVDGYRLGAWVANQRSRRHTLSRDRSERLEELTGWEWDAVVAKWEEGYNRVLEYARRNGDARIPFSYTVDGFKLGSWVNTQRTNHARGTLDPERAQRLRDLPGWTWDARADRALRRTPR